VRDKNDGYNPSMDDKTPLEILYEALKGRSKTPFTDDVEIPETLPDLNAVVDFIWKSDWSDARKLYSLGVAMYMIGVQDSEDSIHPVAQKMINTLQELDDQGIDIEGAMVSLIPRQGPPRPEQMAKWPAIFKLN